MTPLQPRYSKEEFDRRGQEIYERDIRPHLQSADDGKFVAIDIETAAYEADRDDYMATERLLARTPDAQIWLVRVGHRATYRIGRQSAAGGKGMITGIVNARLEATIRVSIKSAGGQYQEIEAVVDTGFSGSLTLPPTVIVGMGLVWRSRGSALLANGNRDQFDIHTATLTWDDTDRNILVEAADTDPLVGMRLLSGSEIRIQAVAGGNVTITALP